MIETAGRQRRRIDVLEIRDVGRVAGGLIGIGEIDRRGILHHQRVGADAAVDRVFGAVIGNRVVARAGVDDVDAAAAVDDIVARARRDHVGRGRAGDGQRRGDDRRVEVLEIGDADAVADGLVGSGRDREIDRRDAA